MRNCVRAFKRFKDFGDGSLVNQLPTNLFVEHPLCTPGLENSFGGKQHHWNNKTKCLKKTQDLLKKNSSGKTDPLTRRKFLHQHDYPDPDLLMILGSGNNNLQMPKVVVVKGELKQLAQSE